MRETLPGIFYTVLFFIGILTIFFTLYLRLKKTGFKQDKKWDVFFEEERTASFITKKDPIPSSLLWSINTSAIPLSPHKDCTNAYEKVLSFKEAPLADLRNYSNLELKKRFGMNHLQELIVCEQRYFECMRALVAYGRCLKEAGFFNESKEVLLYALEKKCDYKECYLSLIQIYAIMQDEEGLAFVQKTAIASKQYLVYYETIINALQEASIMLK